MNKAQSHAADESVSKSTLAKLSALFPLYLLIAVILAVSYFLAMKNDYDASLGYFENGSAAHLISRIITAVSVLFALIAAVVLGKKSKVVGQNAASPVLIFSYTLAALSSIAVFALFITGLSYNEYSKIDIVAEVLTLGSAAFYAMMFFGKTRGTDACRVLGCVNAAAVMMLMFERYFDFSIPLNGDVRNVTTIVLCAGLLELLAQLQLLYADRAPKTSGAESHVVLSAALQIFSAITSSTVLPGYALGMLIYTATQSDYSDPNLPMFRSIFFIAVSIPGIVRCASGFSCRKASSDKNTASDK